MFQEKNGEVWHLKTVGRTWKKLNGCGWSTCKNTPTTSTGPGAGSTTSNGRARRLPWSACQRPWRRVALDTRPRPGVRTRRAKSSWPSTRPARRTRARRRTRHRPSTSSSRTRTSRTARPRRRRRTTPTARAHTRLSACLRSSLQSLHLRAAPIRTNPPARPRPPTRLAVVADRHQTVDFCSSGRPARRPRCPRPSYRPWNRSRAQAKTRTTTRTTINNTATNTCTTPITEPTSSSTNSTTLVDITAAAVDRNNWTIITTTTDNSTTITVRRRLINRLPVRLRPWVWPRAWWWCAPISDWRMSTITSWPVRFTLR